MPAADPPAAPAARSAVAARLRAAGCVYAEDEADLLISAARSEAELAALVDRRAEGQPLEYVLGWAEFCGLRIAVDPAVFIPRRRTEFLAGQAIALARPGAVVVDLCCGSGALAAALAAAVPGAGVHAADIDPAAVRCARRNLATAGGQVYQGDLFGPLPARTARPGGHPAGQRALRAHQRGRAAAAGSPRPRGADGPGRRRGRPGGAAAGGRRGAGVAGTWRASAVRDQRAPGGRSHHGGHGRRADRVGGEVEEHGATVLVATRPAEQGPAGPRAR